MAKTASTTTTLKPLESEISEIDIQVGKVKMTLRNFVDPNLLSDILKVLMHYA